MKRHVIRIIKLVAGWVFVVLGVLGLFLPFLQGILFLAIGLAILATEQVWAQRLLTWLRRRFPRFAQTLDHGWNKSERWFQKVLHRRREPL